MRIGEVAQAAGVAVHTLRYYERIGLIPPPRRSGSGYRDYAPSVVERIHFIVNAKQFGFSLSEIQELLALRDGEPQCEPAHKIASERLRELDNQLEELGETRAALYELLESCSGAEDTCGIIEQLEEQNGG